MFLHVPKLMVVVLVCLQTEGMFYIDVGGRGKRNILLGHSNEAADFSSFCGVEKFMVSIAAYDPYYHRSINCIIEHTHSLPL